MKQRQPQNYGRCIKIPTNILLLLLLLSTNNWFYGLRTHMCETNIYITKEKEREKKRELEIQFRTIVAFHMVIKSFQPRQQRIRLNNKNTNKNINNGINGDESFNA